jgi:hypothetical protein
MIARKFLAAGAALAMLSTSVVQAQEAPPHDLLLATLWTQRSVEYKVALTVFALARSALDEALADKLTAAPVEKGDFAICHPRPSMSTDAGRQFALSGVDAEEQPDLQHQDLERVLRGPGVARHPGRRLHQVRRSRA